MLHNGRKVDKAKTQAAILAALPAGWRFIGINWKKGCKVRVVDPHGRVKVITKG